MLEVAFTGAFRRDYRLVEKRGKRIELLEAVMRMLIEQKPLNPQQRDHVLVGNWAGRRECHIEPDWLLIYKLEVNTIIFERTGTHSDLFR